MSQSVVTNKLITQSFRPAWIENINPTYNRSTTHLLQIFLCLLLVWTIEKAEHNTIIHNVSNI